MSVQKKLTQFLTLRDDRTQKYSFVDFLYHIGYVQKNLALVRLSDYVQLSRSRSDRRKRIMIHRTINQRKHDSDSNQTTKRFKSNHKANNQNAHEKHILKHRCERQSRLNVPILSNFTQLVILQNVRSIFLRAVL